MFSLVIDEPVGDMAVRAVSVAKDVVVLGGVVGTLWVTGHELAVHMLQTMSWSPCVNGPLAHVNCSRSERDFDA